MKKTFSIEQIESLLKTINEFKQFNAVYMQEGVSTEVYKLQNGKQELFLRLADEGNNISTEVMAYELIEKLGVSAPRVVYYEDFNNLINRSFCITTKINGESYKKVKKETNKEELAKAGEDIAKVNTIRIKGFGWLDRSKEAANTIVGTYKSYYDFVLKKSRIEYYLKNLTDSNILTTKIADDFINVFEKRKHILDFKQAYLAHGDFDTGHIFIYKGKYSGIIDFGDIRATSRYHDLAHIYTHNNYALEHIVKGYERVTKLENDYMEKIEMISFYFALGKIWWQNNHHPHKDLKKLNAYKIILELISKYT